MQLSKLRCHVLEQTQRLEDIRYVLRSSVSDRDAMLVCVSLEICVVTRSCSGSHPAMRNDAVDVFLGVANLS